MTEAVTRLPFPSPREKPFDPPAIQTTLRETCPLIPVELLDGQPAWVVTRYDDVRSVLSDPRVTSRGVWQFAGSANRAAAERGEKSLTVMDPPEHTHSRRLFTKYFTLRRVEALRPKIQAIIDDTFDAAQARGGTVDVVSELALPIASQTMCMLVGVPYADHDWYEELTHVRNQLDGDPAVADAATQELLAYMSRLVDDKREHPGDDLISQTLADLLEPGLISRDELVATLRLLLTAGHDTTATMMSTSVFVLLTHPDQLARLREDPSLLPGAIEELLRYISMLFILIRVARDDLEVSGCPVRSGDGLIAAPALANKDPRAFPDPDRFDITRDAQGHVAFGFGPHQCLGQPVARLEMTLFLQTLLRRMPQLRLAVPADTVTFRKTNLIGVESLPVSW